MTDKEQKPVFLASSEAQVAYALHIVDKKSEQPEQKPVAWMTHYSDMRMPMFHRTKEGALGWQKDPEPLPLYTSPQPAQQCVEFAEPKKPWYKFWS